MSSLAPVLTAAPAAKRRRTMPVDPELLEPFERLIRLWVNGHEHDVPENNSVLRSLQYLDVDLYPCRLCWNGDCDNCCFDFVDPATGTEVTARGCESTVFEDMRITRLPTSSVWTRGTREPPEGS